MSINCFEFIFPLPELGLLSAQQEVWVPAAHKWMRQAKGLNTKKLSRQPLVCK
jgi:hypothetical protein